MTRQSLRIAAAALLLALLIPGSAAATTDRQANARSLTKAAATLRRDRRLGVAHRNRVLSLHRKHRLAAVAQRSTAAGGEACEGERLTPQPSNLDKIRAATLCLVNRQRLLRHEKALSPNGKLQHAAQGHTASMVSEDYFSHYAPNGQTPSQRMKASGYIYSGNIGYEIGENIAWGTLNLSTPKAIVQAWMESPGHRENILDGHYRETAIGVLPQVPQALAEGQAGAIYTQDFGVIIAN